MAGLIRRLLGLGEKRTTLSRPAQWLIDWVSGGAETVAGIRVNHESALRLSAVYACVRVISETVASLPLHVYERLEPRGKQRLYDHPVTALVHDAPNEYMTAMSFWETLVSHAVLWGNGFARIDSAGSWPRAMQIMTPDRMNVTVVEGALRYEWRDPITNKSTVSTASEMLHVPGLGFNGITGYSPIELAKQNIGLGLAAEQYGGAFFGNSGRPSGVLTHPGVLDTDKNPATTARLRKDWKRIYGGAQTGTVAVLEEGMKFEPITMPHDDAQFIETRKFQIEEIARLYRVPLHKIGHLEHATFSNIQHQSLEFLMDTIRPWLVRICQEVNRKLLGSGNRNLYVAHTVEDILRGDIQTRFSAYATARQWGWMSANEIRELEDTNPIDGGDVYFVPLNMGPAGGADKPVLSVGDGKEDDKEDDNGTSGRSYEIVFADAFRRVLRIEQSKLARAAKLGHNSRDDKDFSEWLDVFLGEHVMHVRAAIGSAVDGCAALVWEQRRGAPPPKDNLALFVPLCEEIAERHIAETRKVFDMAVASAIVPSQSMTFVDAVNWSQRADEQARWAVQTVQERIAQILDGRYN